MPLAAFTNRAIASRMSRMSSLREAKIVFEVTLNWWLHALHFHKARVV